jgi:hypothetical protein
MRPERRTVALVPHSATLKLICQPGPRRLALEEAAVKEHDVPDRISYDTLLCALDSHYLHTLGELNSVYFVQLRHALLSLARRARLEVSAQQITGLEPADIHQKSTTELISLMDQQRTGTTNSEHLRYWWQQ